MTKSSEVTIAPQIQSAIIIKKQWRGDDTHRVEGPSQGGPSARHFNQTLSINA